MKILSIFLFLVPLSVNASACLSPPQNWKRTATTFDIEESKVNKLYDPIIKNIFNSLDPEDIKLFEETKHMRIDELRALENKYKDGDAFFELKAPPLSGPILLCLTRKALLVQSIVVGYQ